ncbi:hypothetical protein SLE2022_296730 [Rubroshorea leprosula]
MANPIAFAPSIPDSKVSIPDTLLHSFENLHLNNGIGSGYAISPYLTAPATSNTGGILAAPNLQLPIKGFLPSTNHFGGWETTNAVAPVPSESTVILRSALTQFGSQKLQQYLAYKDSAVINLVFEAVMDSIFQIMTDQFGHHVFGNLIPLCNQNQLNMIATMIVMHHHTFIEVCLDRYGSPSVKRLIKLRAKSDYLDRAIVRALHLGFLHLMVHKTGCHVILQCMETLSIEDNELLYEETIKNFFDLATDVNGCLALNCVIDVIKGPRRNDLLEAIADLAVCLSQDPYGNFVVQKLLGLQYPNITKKICYLLKDHYARISMLKGGSHVVERCLQSSERGYAVEAFVECQGQVLVNVARDQFGNYVIQTALKETKHADRELHDRLVMKLRSHRLDLQRGYGRNVYNLINVNQDSY